MQQQLKHSSASKANPDALQCLDPAQVSPPKEEAKYSQVNVGNSVQLTPIQTDSPKLGGKPFFLIKDHGYIRMSAASPMASVT